MENGVKFEELLELRNYYKQEKLKFLEQKEEFSKKHELIYDKVIENIKDGMDTTPNSSRLQRYLESTAISDFKFLVKAFNDKTGNNLFRSLTYHRLLSLDDEVYKIAKEEYGMLFRGDVEDISRYHDEDNLSHSFFENTIIKEKMEKVRTLAFLDEIFDNLKIILHYQGAYTVYQYTKRYLKEVLKDNLPQTDNELI